MSTEPDQYKRLPKTQATQDYESLIAEPRSSESAAADAEDPKSVLDRFAPKPDAAATTKAPVSEAAREWEKIIKDLLYHREIPDGKCRKLVNAIDSAISAERKETDLWKRRHDQAAAAAYDSDKKLLSALRSQQQDTKRLVDLLSDIRPVVNNAANDPTASPWQKEIRLAFLNRIDAAMSRGEERKQT